jgi:alpha-soluble NSF attachment protein
MIEQVARTSLDNTLLKYAAKEYFFKAAICHFCMSPQAAQVSY